MITYVSDRKRLCNFEQSKSKFTSLQMFKAIVPSFFDAEQIGLFAHSFISKGNPKKIGTSLSHYFVQKNSVEDGNDWAFVMEDDFEFGNLDEKFLRHVISEAEKNDSSFVSFDCRPRFHAMQFKEERKTGIFYRMIKQWGLGCYLVSKEASKLLLSIIPIEHPTDMHWLFHNIHRIKNPMVIDPALNPFVNCGMEAYYLGKGKYGSIARMNGIKLL